MQNSTSSRRKKLGFRLLGSVLLILLLLTVALLAADRLLSSPQVKEKIHQTLVAHTGLQIGYEKIGIEYFPSFNLELHQLTFATPDTIKGKADILRLTPSFVDLLLGKPGLGKVELVRPDIELAFPQPHPDEKRADAEAQQGFTEGRDVSFVSLFSFLPKLHVKITDGRFSVAFDSQSFTGEHLTLSLDGAIDNPRSGTVLLNMELAELAARSGERRETIKGVKLRGNIRADDSNVICQLNQLFVANPALTLSGNLTTAQDGEKIALSLSGTNIHVDSTRKTALALAGDISPVTEIFTYLAGGTVPQITFTSQGKNASELGELENMRIEGHLQDGTVRIPEIDMTLTEVNGDVVIADGVLTGTGLLARLAESAGHSGMLKLGLAEGNDLFRLELMLNADMGQTQRIVKHITEKSKFSQELDHITNLKGNGTGKLILGDSLVDMNARIENADINLSFNYPKVPYPISISKGRVNLTNNQVVVQGVSATVGKSEISGLGGTVQWGKDIHLDISAERAGVSLDELYLYLDSIKETKTLLNDVKDISGRMDVSSASFSGNLGTPKQWNFTSAGSVRGLNLKANGFPGSIKLTKGNFTFDPTQLNLQDVVTEALDANLTLNGMIGGLFSQSGQMVKMSVNGTMGRESVGLLQDTFKVPKAYSIRTPVTLKDVRISGQPIQDVIISGGLAVKDGPQITLEMQNHPEELKVEKLTVNDQYSEAGMTFVSRNDGLRASFTGRLRSETLEGLFVDPKWGKGHLEGDFSVNLPKKSKTAATAQGHLKGTNVVIPLGSGDEVSIEQVLLEADGSIVQANASTLTWRDFTWNPLTAVINFEHDTLRIKVNQAALCGIHSSGVVDIIGKEFDLDVTMQGTNLDIGTSYSCLTQGRVKMTGNMEFSSHIKAKGERGELIGKLEGPLKMTFRQGVVEQNRILSILLEVLNVTEIVKGRLPNMATTGFKYTVITVEGQFKNGKLVVDKLFVDGETLDILGFGELDLEKETVSLELLAAPFKTVDSVIKYIPGVNYLMGNSLVVIPVSVNGTLANPKVDIRSPSSVSKGLLNLGARALKLPYKLMESIISGGQ